MRVFEEKGSLISLNEKRKGNWKCLGCGSVFKNKIGLRINKPKICPCCGQSDFK